MIQIHTDTPAVNGPVKAVGLLSGGLDSTVAAAVVRDLGIEVYGVYFAMPWGCCDKGRAQEAADRLGIRFLTLQLDERYLEMVRKPRYGYGSGINPCVDCRIHMFTRARRYMESIGADFVFTGEVLGQRPMSQMRHSMRCIEKGAGLEGRLLRPLCARLLDPTLPEQDGRVDRGRLLELSGRSRKEQMRMAAAKGISDYPNPGSGCLLTDRHFARRMKDTLAYGYRSFRETVALKWGRHVRFDPHFKAIVGRDEDENAGLIHYAHPDDRIFQFEDNRGPTVILKGVNPPDDILARSAWLVQRFSRYKEAPPMEVLSWPSGRREEVRRVRAVVWEETALQEALI